MILNLILNTEKIFCFEWNFNSCIEKLCSWAIAPIVAGLFQVSCNIQIFPTEFIHILFREKQFDSATIHFSAKGPSSVHRNAVGNLCHLDRYFHDLCSDDVTSIILPFQTPRRQSRSSKNFHAFLSSPNILSFRSGIKKKH